MTEEMNTNRLTPFIFLVVGVFLGFIVVNLPVISLFQPILSVLFLYLGLQRLRSENMYLNISWMITLAMLGYTLLYIVFLSAPTLAGTQASYFLELLYIESFISCCLYFLDKAFIKSSRLMGNRKTIY